MPIYDFRHNETNEEWYSVMSYTDKAEYCFKHNCISIIKTAPKLVSGTKDAWSQTDDGFKERMKGIKATGGRQTTIE